jgi:hypothetical protein
MVLRTRTSILFRHHTLFGDAVNLARPGSGRHKLTRELTGDVVQTEQAVHNFPQELAAVRFEEGTGDCRLRPRV